MMQGTSILWPYCQPTLHWAQLAGVGLVRRYKNDPDELMTLCSFRTIHSKVIDLRLIIVRLPASVSLQTAMYRVQSP